MRKHKPSAVRFFFSHAGYSYDPKTETKIQGRWRGARALAKAEREAKELGLVFVWDQEQSPDTSWMDEGQLKELEDGNLEMLSCYVFQDVPECGMCETWTEYRNRHDTKHTILASLGNICLGVDDRNYRRVVKAELALEAIAELEDIDSHHSLLETGTE